MSDENIVKYAKEVEIKYMYVQTMCCAYINEQKKDKNF